MTNYKVTSDRLADKKLGEIISEADLAGSNIEALLEGGHIAVIHKATKKDEE